MRRSITALAILLASCDTPSPELRSLESEVCPSDVAHHRFTIPVGDGPNAKLTIHRVVRERSPGRPRPTTAAIVLMHGDFSSFDTNFPVMATWLAENGVDVWGIDQRWTHAAPDGDLSDFGAMSLEQEL